MSLQDPGNLLETEDEFELDKETTATFCDDRDEYLLQGPFDSIEEVVKSPTEEEHLLGILSKGELPTLDKIPLGTHFILLSDWFVVSLKFDLLVGSI